MTTSHDNIQERLQALRESYVKGLPEKIKNIQVLWSNIRKLGWNEDDAKELYRQVHTIAGSAPTFGCSEAGLLARKVTIIMKKYIQLSEHPNDTDFNKMAQALSELFSYNVDSTPEPLKK